MRLLLLVLAVTVSTPATAQQGARDCPQCPEMVPLPRGSFMMGAAPDEESREGVSQDFRGFSAPQVRVTIGGAVAIGRYEVTRAEFAAFVQATGHQTGPSCNALDTAGDWGPRQGLSWRNPGFPQTDRHPVVCVNWDDARLYAAWLSRTTGKAYRLPTEAEWEFAARAGSASARYWGDGRDAACRHANVADQTMITRLRFGEKPQVFSCTDGHAQTAPVGRFTPNAFGLHDMLGNVWEWVEDCWNTSHAGAPGTGEARRDGDCASRVARGGGWFTNPVLVRSANRYGVEAGDRDSDMGFRVVRAD